MSESAPLLLSQTAVNWDQLLFAALAIVFMFGSAIFGWIKKKMDDAAAERQRRDRELRGESSAAPVEADDGPSLEERAAQRRAQLGEAARSRVEANVGASPGRPGGPEPQNLTMAERIARARAKEQYRQRAEQIRQDPEAARRRAMEQAAAQREATRREAMQRQTAQRQRQAELEQRRAAEIEQRRRNEAELARRRPERATSPQRRDSTRPQRQTPHQLQPPPRAQAPTAASRPSVARPPSPLESAAATLRPPTAGAAGHRTIPGLPGLSLRDALIAKEILDRPVAMRDPSADAAF